MDADRPRADVLEWVERIAKYCADQDGLPLIAGRILGWLTVCVPAEQSAAQIAEAIGASRASLTTNLRLLTSVGFLDQITKPGERTVYYRVDDAAWARVVQRQVQSLSKLGGILRDGLDLIDSDGVHTDGIDSVGAVDTDAGGRGEHGARMRTAHAVFAWLDDVFAAAPPPPVPTGTTSTTRRER